MLPHKVFVTKTAKMYLETKNENNNVSITDNESWHFNCT